jgi:asparagine synthase (glutamine-hydrolysing)
MISQNVLFRTKWFVVLPDRVLGNGFDELAKYVVDVVRYPSGRPWVVGRWPREQATVGVAGDACVLLLGWTSVSADELNASVAGARDVSDLDRLALRAAGNHHLVASVGGRLRVQGTASGNRRVFHASCGTDVIAADRADVLAWLTGGDLDEQAVALRLLDPAPPHPLLIGSMWHDVHSTPAGEYLLVDRDGQVSTRRWWRPPEPVLTLDEGAPRLRDALETGISTRVTAEDTLTCDLSGGLDSTSVCFLASGMGARLIAYTSTALDPADDDIYWARLAASRLPNVVHDELPDGLMPVTYAGISRSDECLDEPYAALLDRAQLLMVYGRMAAHGGRVHLTGFGGDEVIESSPVYLAELFRRRPMLAWKRLRGYRAASRWPWGQTLRTLYHARPYADWLSDAADQVSERPSGHLPDLDWDVPPRLPPWVTAPAVELVRDALRNAATEATPLASTRGEHADLAVIRLGAHLNRLTAQFVEQTTGLCMAAPMVDDRVVEACLSVRPEDRGTPWQYKPLLVAAIRGVVPDRSLGRDTKAEGSAEEAAGLQANAGELRSLVDDSRLVALGFVDPDRLRAACRYSAERRNHSESLQQTFASEVWLRNLESAHSREATHLIGERDAGTT